MESLALNNTLTTGLEAASTITELPPTAHVTVGFDTESECGEDGDWFMASEDMSGTSGPKDFVMTNDYNSSNETEVDSDTDLGLIDDSNLRDDIKLWAVATNTPISHLSSLLSLLRKHLPNANLPKDGRTLLSTPTCTEVQ